LQDKILTQKFSKNLNFKTEGGTVCLLVSYKKKMDFFASLKAMKKRSDQELDPDPDPNPLVRGMDPRIRIRTKMLRNPNNTAEHCH
jgi:hypothetical protein